MLAPRRLAQLASSGRDLDLLGAVLRNGRPLPEPARRRLEAPENLAGAAAGLALLRASELALGPSPHVADLAGALLDRRRDGGSFGAVPATAAAIAGLAAAGRGDEPSRAALDGARAWLRDALARATPALDAALAAWLLPPELAGPGLAGAVSEAAAGARRAGGPGVRGLLAPVFPDVAAA